MSAQKKVITIKGEELPISKCRKFNGVWYKIGDINVQESGDCYLIGDRYYREETGAIVYNYSSKCYTLNNDSLIKGVVAIIDDLLIHGFFENNKSYSKIIDKTNSRYLIFDTNILKNNREYRECLSNGDFYHISKLSSNKFNQILLPKKEYKYSLPYDSKGIIDKNLKNYNDNYNPQISKSIKNYAPLLGNLTFGLEFETTRGFIPNRILNEYGLIPLRDGSISGIEYVTVPMSGEKGLQCSHDILNTLKDRTKYDDSTCSLHLHLGNIPRTKEFILAFFKMGIHIQDEMFSMFPLYKKYNYRIKNKNYSAPLPTCEILSQLDPTINSSNLDENFKVLYKYLSMGQNFESVDCNLDNIISHPADPNGNQKWNVRTRYSLFNLIPLIFGNKKTIEFRIHTPTYEVNKIIPFILMNSLLVNFVIKYQSNILSTRGFLNQFTLIDIIRLQTDTHDIVSNGKIKDLMSEYINTRKDYCESQTRSGNILGTEDEIPTVDYINWSKIEQGDEVKEHVTTINTSLKSDNIYVSYNIDSMVEKLSSHFDGLTSPSLYDQITTYISPTITKNKPLNTIDNGDIPF